MPRGTRVAKTNTGAPPDILSMAYNNGQTFKASAFVVLSSGAVSECANSPTKITGLALEGAGTKPGYDAANSPTVVTGRVQEVSVAVGNRNTVFALRGVSGGTDPVTPVVGTHVGNAYGVAKDANGDWYLNIADTTNKSLIVIDVDVDSKTFFCKIVDSFLSLP